MTTQLDPHTALMFRSLTAQDQSNASPRRSRAWASEARLQLLALEIARYMPKTADKLARAGKARLAA